MSPHNTVDDDDQYVSSLPGAVATARRPLLPGVYVPTMCFFDLDTEDVDVDTVARHAVRLARAGVTGLATQGSNGEAVHLSDSERRLVTMTTREALDEAGFGHVPIIVGCGAQSVRETVSLCRDARRAGGDYALVLPPSYYSPLFGVVAETVVAYFGAVADQSPVPIIIYNYPAAAGGIDLSSDTIIRLAGHPNIAGVKLTCGNTGKLNRVASGTAALAAATAAPAQNGGAAAATKPAPSQFLVLAGSADFAIQSLIAGGHGILAGLGNIAPRACVQLVRLFLDGRTDEARAVQDIVSRGDWAAIQGGIVGGKAALQGLLGYGGFARAPLPRPGEDEAARWKAGFAELWRLEQALAAGKAAA